MKLKFKLIPFLLSLLIVFGVTFGICWYSYHDYPINRYTFYEEYFHLNDYEEYETTELLENSIKFQFNEYTKASSTVSVHASEKEDAPTYKNGTIHVPGYFDIDVYITNTINQGESTYSYYFYFYNVDYQHSAFDPADRIKIVVVEGSGKGVPGEDESEEDIYGDALLDRELEELFDEDENNNPKYSGLYPFAWTREQNTYPVFDNGFKNDENNPDITEHYVYRASPRQSHVKDEIFNESVPADGTATFAIVATNAKYETEYEELVRGTISDIDKLEELELEEGYAEDVYKTNYAEVVRPKVILHGSIAFVISAVIAILFYLLWMDPKNKDNKKNIKPNKKANKK